MRDMWDDNGFRMGEHYAIGDSGTEEDEQQPEEGCSQAEQICSLQMRILQQGNPFSYSPAGTQE